MLNERATRPTFSDRARKLRKALTKSEQLLWQHLRRKKCRGYKFRRQVPIGIYIVDFLCTEHRVIVELDGDSHYEEGAETYDQKRTDYLQSQGFIVLRFNNSQIRESLSWILETIGNAVDRAAMHINCAPFSMDGDFRRTAFETKE